MHHLTLISRRWLLAICACLGFAIPSGVLLAGGQPAGAQTTKVYAFITKRSDLTDEQFSAHWRDPHARLALKTSLIRGYVQNHAVGAALPGFPLMSRSGIAAIWVDGVDSLAKVTADPAYAEVHEDELNLLDRSSLQFLITQEQTLVRGPAADDPLAVPMKAMLFLRRSEGVAADRMAAVVRRAARAGRAMNGGHRVTYAFPAPGAYGENDAPAYDAVIELYFPNRAAFEEAWRRSGPALLRRLEPAADLSRSDGFLAVEERKRWPPFGH
jgi:hypothetical protein